MASSSQSGPAPKATWDESNTGIFLTLLVDEIDAGNRPSGHFSKIGWTNITNKFVQLSGCNFTMPQLKNKWDNMKKDFSLWEKLLHEETGLGYDVATSRIVADPVWWRNKLQVRPEYRKFRTHGPLHLELQERVFRGVVATGYMEYYPEDDTFLGDEIPEEAPPQPEVMGDMNNNENEEPVQGDEVPPVDGVTADVGTRGGTAPKRKRTRSTTTKATVGDVNRGMVDMLNAFREESASSIRQIESRVDEYQEAVKKLVEIPWLDISSPEFATLIILLEDPKKRSAFQVLSELGEVVIKNWIEAWNNRT